MNNFNIHPVYPILDIDRCASEQIQFHELLRLWSSYGIQFFQLRAKSFSKLKYLEIAKAVKKCFPDLKIIANDFLKVAVDNSDIFTGIHLGQDDFASLDITEKSILREITQGRLKESRDGNRFITGISTHNLAEIKDATNFYFQKGERVHQEIKIPWSYVACGPVISGESKKYATEPVIKKYELLEICKYLAGNFFMPENQKQKRLDVRANQPSQFDIVFIGGVDSKNITAIIPSDFFSKYQFLPVVALIKSATNASDLKSVLNYLRRLQDLTYV